MKDENSCFETLDDCMENYLRPDSEVEEYACDSCKNKGEAYIQTEIMESAQILVIQIMRKKLVDNKQKDLDGKIKYDKKIKV